MQEYGSIIPDLEEESGPKSFTNPHSLLKFLNLDPEKSPFPLLSDSEFPFKVTRSYAEKIQKNRWTDPLLLQCLPRGEETQVHENYYQDPVGDENATVAPGLIHKYKNRALLTLSPECSMHCRYCFRKNYAYHAFTRSEAEWFLIWKYIESHKEINEIILSGGDPLTVSNRHLKEVFDTLEYMPHIKTVRIHSRIPAISPQRINLNFMRLLSEYQNTGLNIVLVHHINHPNEIGYDNQAIFAHLKQAGVIQLNQSVLLKDVNDNTTTLVDLSQKLLNSGIIPYYLHQLDQVEGARHFYVDPQKGCQLVREMNEEMQGYGVPKYVCEESGKKSKTPIL